MVYFPRQGGGFSAGTCGLYCDALVHILYLRSLVAYDYCQLILAVALIMGVVLSPSLKQELIAVSILIVGRPSHLPFYNETIRLDPSCFGHAAGRLFGLLCVLGDLSLKHHYAGALVYLVPLLLFSRVVYVAHNGNQAYLCATYGRV